MLIEMISKDGKVCKADKDQVDALKKAGYKVATESEVKKASKKEEK